MHRLASLAMNGQTRKDLLAWALLFVLAAQTAIFLAAAGRGLDLTDESFYLLTFQHWTKWPSVALFGAYFALPYTLLGQSVWAIRALGFVLLLCAGVWFSYELNRLLSGLAQRSTRDGLVAASLAGGAGIWNYYGGSPVPYTPSYNLLTLACALGTLAMALRVGQMIYRGEDRALLRNSFALGLIASIGIATKVSAGLLVLGLSSVILTTFGWQRTSIRIGLGVALALVAGAVLNVALLLIADPALPTRFQRGIAVTLAMFPRDPANELATFLAMDIPRAFMSSLRILMWPLVLALLAFVLATRTSRRPLLVALAIFVFVSGAVLDIYIKDNRFYRIALMTILAVCLVIAALWTGRGSMGDSPRVRACIVIAALLIVPFAYSFGTNNPLLQHMGMAAVFPAAVAVSQVRAMWVGRSIPTWVFALCLLFLAAAPAEIVGRQWTNGNYTYRLGAPLTEQTVRMPPNAGRIDLLVAPSLARGADDYLRLVRESGFVAGQPMIDFTGQSPGLVALAGAVPLGAIWIVGGPRFDGERMARMSLGYLADSDVRHAWLLTSEDSFARIASWTNILEAKLGAFAHEQVGKVTIPDPTSDDKTKTIEVTLWRPKA